MIIDLKVKLLHKSAMVPKFMSEGAAGADLFACVDSPVEITPGDFMMIPTGIAIAIPIGFEGEVRPRSGLAKRLGITVLNAPGTIDSDYRGEVCVILINHGKKTFIIENGNRIAQLLIKPVASVQFITSKNLSETDRNGGFGSTGI